MKNLQMYPCDAVRTVSLILLLMVLPGPAIGQYSTPTDTIAARESVFSQLDNTFILDLNSLAYTVAEQHDHFYSFIGIRALTMVHLAIHDILNTEDPKYERYHYKGNKTQFDPICGAAESTRILLSSAYPKKADTIAVVCQKWIDQAKNKNLGAMGIEAGREVAEAYLSLREQDGHDKQGEYIPMTKPGSYQYTPGWNDWVLKPDFDYARPFALESVSQFRSPSPPDIKSADYTTSYEEVRAYGKKDSPVRSQDQLEYAYWWAEFGEHSWNRIGRITARERDLPASQTARMFALINLDIYDIYLASLESKYFYDTWRPFTAIRTADHNPKTEPDSEWEPEMLTPPWPEYPSAHAAVGAGGAEILMEIYGSPKVSFTMESVTALPHAKSRTFTNLEQAATECADSRVMNGYHFRFATEEGMRQGKLIARYILDNFLTPLD